MCIRLKKNLEVRSGNAVWFRCVQVRDTKGRGCCSVRFSWSLASTGCIYTTKHVLALANLQ